MKKVIALFLCIALLVSSAALPTSALDGSADTHMTISKEYLPDGSYFVVEIIQQSPLARSSTTSGSKTATHYNSQGTPIWKITVNGTFTYSSGISARATSASATVGIADGNAQFIEKNAYTSGASAYGYGKVKYIGSTASKTVVLSCDRYGKLS